MPGETAYLGVGSNLGDREAYIRYAAERIAAVLSEFRRSSIYETPPMYREDQPVFLNCVFCGRSRSTSPLDLLKTIRDIEHESGRDRARSGWMGPRPVDIDILLFGERVVRSDELTIPHPRMKERPFVLIPLVELAPDLRDPVTGEFYAEIAADLGAKGIYHYAD